MCGEYFPDDVIVPAVGGSPPRVRGIQHVAEHVQGGPGITPACAGNTRGVRPGLGVLWDHPRVCGEYRIKEGHIPWFTGSPPRVRGIREVQQTAPQCEGITPACAGNTRAVPRACRLSGDHPRVCGEYLSDWFAALDSAGSPPRVRGILFASWALE